MRAQNLILNMEEIAEEIELPDMFEYENYWLRAPKPMSNDTLQDFLKSNICWVSILNGFSELYLIIFMIC